MSKFVLTQRRSRCRKSPAISLFPFLAVLICTMGALVPLLLAMARQARLQALQEATAKAAQRQVDAQSERELAEWRISELKTARSQAEERLTQVRLALGHVENHARRLRQQADQLQAAMENLDRDGVADSRDRADLERELQQVQDQIAEAEKQLAEARKAADARPRSYAVIPYQGPNGTWRPPIYIECRADAIVLQPQGIALVEADFEEPIEANNPLDQALRAARESLLAQGQIRGDGSDEPYPLLLVRPDGIPAYYVARAALASWKSAIGYELVGKDWELEFPTGNPEVGRAMRAVVAEAREQRRRRAVLTAMLANTKSPGAWSAAWGAVPAGGVGAGVAFATEGGSGAVGATAQATGPPARQSRGAGFQPSTDPRSYGVGGKPPNAPAVHNVPAGSLEQSGKAWASRWGGDNPLREPAGEPAEGGAKPASSAHSERLTPDGAMAGTVFGGGKSPSRDSRVTYRAAPGGGLIREIEPDSSNSAALLRRGLVKAPGGTDAGTGAAGQGQPIAQAPRRPVPESPTEAKADAQAAAMRPGEWIPQETTPANANQPEERSNPRDAKNKRLADSRGENWGLPNAARGSVGITRPIRVRCTSNRLEILPDDPKADRKLVPLGERIEDSIDDFVSAVWEHMKTWGIAGRGMYWRPILRVEVTPDAEFRFEEFKTLLDNSGLMVERKS
jgi:hypothetical protein